MSTLLFSPYTIKGVTIKNRIIMSPMCMYSCEKEDGNPTNFHFVHYASRAIGQVGLIIVEATAVLPEGRISSRDLGIWDNEHMKEFRQLVTLVHEQGSKIGIQLAHAGRKAELETPCLAPSAIAFDEKYKAPYEMTIDDINQAISAFRQGARRAKEAGFDVIEIHGAHGYLINEFLSPLTNQRTDDYGGTKEKRYRFLREIIDEVKQEWTGPLFVRISAEDYAEGGYTTADYVEVVKWMKAQGVDVIDISSGGVVPAKINTNPGYQVPYAAKIRKETNIITGTVGLITSGIQAEEILQNEEADLIIIGRELLRNPHFPRTAANELGFELSEPKQYERAPGKLK